MKYTGGCHCGDVRYEVESVLNPIISCNCSICQRRGHLLAFVQDKDFKLLTSESALGDYQFAKKIIHHTFCKKCGIGAFCGGTGPDGRKMIGINVRCLDGIDLESLKDRIVQVDGASVL